MVDSNNNYQFGRRLFKGTEEDNPKLKWKKMTCHDASKIKDRRIRMSHTR